jgi:hypothetical protein
MLTIIILAVTNSYAIWQKSDANLEQMRQRGSMQEIARYESLLEIDGYLSLMP